MKASNIVIYQGMSQSVLTHKTLQFVSVCRRIYKDNGILVCDAV